MTFLTPALFLFPILASFGSASPLEQSQDASVPLNSRATVGAKSVIVQMFEWTWDRYIDCFAAPSSLTLTSLGPI